MMNTICKFILASCLLIISNAANASDFPLPDLDRYIKNAMKNFTVPGMVVGIINNDSTVYQKAFGVKNVATNEPMDINTIVGLGSTTKTFTAGLAAVLVSEGIIDWDDKVVKYLPDFKLYDDYVTKEVTLRDLLSHRVGIEPYNILWLGSSRTRDEIIYKARLIEPAVGFRAGYVYNNIMILAAGQLMAKAAGKSWDSLVREKIFEPLGMSSSSTSITALKSTDNLATPHSYKGEKPMPISWGNIDNIGPAGSINSNLVDMLKWVRLHLNNGVVNDHQIWNNQAGEEMYSPQSIISGSLTGTPLFRTYGLGWNVWDFKSKLLIWHNGMCDGMYSLIVFMPEKKLGIVIQQNVFHPKFSIPLMLRIMDAYSGLPRDQWWDIGKPGPLRDPVPDKTFKPYDVGSLPFGLKECTGHYDNEMLGGIDVKLKEKRLCLEFQYYPLAVLYQDDGETFVAVFRDDIPFMFKRYTESEFKEVKFIVNNKKVSAIDITGFGVFKR